MLLLGERVDIIHVDIFWLLLATFSKVSKDGVDGRRCVSDVHVTGQ